MHYGASVVWHLSLPLMNSFSKTEAAIFPKQAMLLQDTTFSQNKILMFIEATLYRLEFSGNTWH